MRELKMILPLIYIFIWIVFSIGPLVHSMVTGNNLFGLVGVFNFFFGLWLYLRVTRPKE